MVLVFIAFVELVEIVKLICNHMYQDSKISLCPGSVLGTLSALHVYAIMLMDTPIICYYMCMHLYQLNDSNCRK